MTKGLKRDKKPERKKVTIEPMHPAEREISRNLIGKLLGNIPYDFVTEPSQESNRSKPDLSLDQKIDLEIENTPLDQSDQTQPVEKEASNRGLLDPGLLEPSTETPVGQTPVSQTPVTSTSVQGKNLSLSVNSPGYFMPNWVDDEILPSLPSNDQIVYRRLVRLSLGFNRLTTDSVGVSKLADRCNLSDKAIKRSIKSLEDRRLIRVQRDLSGNPLKGNKYEIIPPSGALATGVYSTPVYSTGVSPSPIKDHDHDDLKDHDHQNARARATMTFYQKLTGNSWTKADDKSYAKIAHLPIDQIVTTMRAVLNRATQKPASLAYFVKEMLNPTQPNPTNREALKKKYGQFIAEIKEANVGGRLTLADLTGALKDRLVREGLPIDEDMINQYLT